MRRALTFTRLLFPLYSLAAAPLTVVSHPLSELVTCPTHDAQAQVRSFAVGLGGKSLIWGPMAASLVRGLTVATTLMLFSMPLRYRLSMLTGPKVRAGMRRR
jgi:hypothetical protein